MEIELFNNERFGTVRTTTINGKPYLMLSDVCNVLEINNPRQAKTRLNAKGVISNDIPTNGGIQKADFINESNFYKLVFQSRKKKAEEFSDWVTSEVLPSIREHGAYMTSEVVEKTITDPDFLIELAVTLKEEKAKRLLAEAENERNKPKVLFAESVETSKNSCLVGELAKLISQNGYEIGQNRLFTWLRDNGYLIKRIGESRNLPTQYSMELGLMEVKKSVINNPDGSIRTTATTKITGKGQIYFVNKLVN